MFANVELGLGTLKSHSHTHTHRERERERRRLTIVKGVLFLLLISDWKEQTEEKNPH